MPRKVLACWSVVILLVAFSQCNQCKTSPVENLTQWELAWDKAAILSNFPTSVDVEESIVCHVPSEDTVYLLNPDGASWKFVQTSAEGLACESIANFSHTGVSNQQSFFAFPAGALEEQSLHVGIVDAQNVMLKKYQGGVWQEVWRDNLAILKNKAPAKGSACSVVDHEKAQCHGLIVLKPRGLGQPSIALCYDTQKLESSSVWQYKGNQAPRTAIEIEPATILVDVKSYASSAIFSWTKEGNNHKMVQGRTPSSLERSNLFLLYAKKLAKYAFWACFVREAQATKLQFYTVTHAYPYTLQRSSDLPEEIKQDDGSGIDHSIDHSESLILPFSEAVYVVTKNKNGQLIYYRGSLQESDGS